MTPKRPSPGEPKTAHHKKNPAYRRQIDVLARRVRSLRRDRGWTVEQAAEEMRIEPVHLRRIEARTANPTVATLISVAAALGVSLPELLSPAK